jgi:alkanesulfonate monooxygenase SsuD/methylene tetrahydromethanopterin reductase-like flavin-dependent oxidoreductase (luciferase family)
VPDIDRIRVQLSLPLLSGIPPRGIVDLASDCERAGLDGVVCGEVAGIDAVAILAAVATVTERITLETNVLSIASRSPSLMAMAACTLADLSNDRFALGIGAGSPAVARFHGSSFANPLAQNRTWLTAVRSAVRGEKVPEFGSFRLSGLAARDVPLYLAAVNPKMLALAGELADGVSLNLSGPEQVRTFGDEARAAAAAAGRDPGFEVMTLLWLDASGDPERGRRLFALEMAPYLAVPTYRRAVVGMSDEDAIDRVVAELNSGGRKAAAAVFPDSILDALVATSQPDVVAKMRAFSDAGCSAVRIAPLTAGSAPSDVQTAIAVLADALSELEQSPVGQL